MIHRIIVSCLGVLLLTAAALKVYGFGLETVRPVGILASPQMEYVAICTETLLGIWLLSGIMPVGSWLAALLTFGSFAILTASLGWQGAQSCGCAGKLVTINPWIASGVDCAIVLTLLVSRPNLQSFWERRTRMVRVAAAVGVGYSVIIGCGAAVTYFYYGSVDAALAAIRHERLSVTPVALDMGEGIPGEIREASLELTNRTNQPIRVFGGTANCNCTVIGDLPATIPPGETRSITIRLRLPDAPGIFSRPAELSIDDQGFKRVGFGLKAQIIKAPKSAEQAQGE